MLNAEISCFIIPGYTALRASEDELLDTTPDFVDGVQDLVADGSEDPDASSRMPGHIYAPGHGPNSSGGNGGHGMMRFLKYFTGHRTSHR